MRFVFLSNGFLLHALTIFFFQILWKVLQVLHGNSDHNLVILGEVKKKNCISSAVFWMRVYESVFSGNLLFPKIEYKNVNGFV